MSVPPGLDLPVLLDELGVALDTVRGDEVWGLCPGHLERTGKADSKPSWSMNIQTGEHHCFSCGYGGSLLYLVAVARGFRAPPLAGAAPGSARRLDLEAARSWLASRTGLPLEAVARLTAWSRPLKPTARPPMSEARLAVFSDVPRWARRARRLDALTLLRYGVRWHPEDEAWVMPIRAPHTNQLWGWQVKGQRTRLFRNLPPGVKKAETLFGLDVFQGSRAILVESPLDAVRMAGLGYDGAIASWGASVSEQQMRLVLSVADELVVALDNPWSDAAGRRAAFALLRDYTARIPMRFFRYSEDVMKDPGAMTDDAIHEGMAGALASWQGKRAVLPL